MTPARKVRELMLPWAGMLGGAIGWSLAHQTGSNSYFAHCDEMTPVLALLIGLVGLVLAVGGALISLPLARRAPEAGGARPFIALISVLFASLFSVAIVWQTISSLIIPRCYG